VNALETCVLLVATIRQVAIDRLCIAELEGQRDSYRELAQVALDEVAHLTRRVERQTATVAQLSDELRTMRRRMAA
jgi:hypothetical protein